MRGGGRACIRSGVRVYVCVRTFGRAGGRVSNYLSFTRVFTVSCRERTGLSSLVNESIDREIGLV